MNLFYVDIISVGRLQNIAPDGYPEGTWTVTDGAIIDDEEHEVPPDGQTQNG